MNRKISQKQKVINHLVKHGSITPLEALNLYGVFRLSAIIHTLRHKHRMNIEQEIAKGDKNYAIYRWGVKKGEFPAEPVNAPEEDEHKDEQDSLFDTSKHIKKDIWPD